MGSPSSASGILLVGFFESLDSWRQVFVQKLQDFLVIFRNVAAVKLFSGGHADSTDQRRSVVHGLLFIIHLAILAVVPQKRNGRFVPELAGGKA
jgi:hypothetical protein